MSQADIGLGALFGTRDNVHLSSAWAKLNKYFALGNNCGFKITGL